LISSQKIFSVAPAPYPFTAQAGSIYGVLKAITAGGTAIFSASDIPPDSPDAPSGPFRK